MSRQYFNRYQLFLKDGGFRIVPGIELPESSTTYFDQIELYFDTVIKITTTPQYEEFGYDILTAPKFAYEIPIRYEIEEQDELLDDAEGKILNKIFVNKPFLDPSNLNYYKK